MDVLRRIRRQDRCAHTVTVAVQSSGIERVVCEACGHVSVHFIASLSGAVDRDRFARAIEREGKHVRPEDEHEDEPLVQVFADAPAQETTARSRSASWWLEDEAQG